MAADDQGAIDNKAVDELLTLQHVAQNAPVPELAGDVAIMFTQLAEALDEFNQLVTSEPCPCGLTPADVQESVIRATTLAIHIAIYTLAIGKRNPAGFHVALRSVSTDLN